MLSLRLNSDSSSIISLSSFDTISSFNDKQFISFNNNKNHLYEKELNPTKSFNETIDQAVEYFEQILNQCTTLSNRLSRQKFDQDVNKNDIKKRDCEEFLRSLNKKSNFKIKQYEQKINCRKWCEEQNQQMTKYYDSINDHNNRTFDSKSRNIYGSTFYCRKALLQKSDGITYICIRKRF